MNILINSNPKVSIVLPVYNVEKYLEQCLESIAAQTYTNFEAIIVIDGSKDNSYEIAKKFCATHERFMVVWQENAGSGSARNNGIAHSTGELMIFIDPDDWVAPDFLETLVRAQQENDYDLVTAGGMSLSENKGKENGLKHIYTEESIVGVENVRRAYARLLSEHKLSAPHKKIYKTSLIKDKGVLYPDYRRTQDLVFNFRYYDKISSLRVLPICSYYYRSDTSGYVKFHYDYYKTVVLIYKEIKDIHYHWKVSISDGLLASIFLDYILSHISRCFDNKWSIKEILKDPTVDEIIRTAHPKLRHLRFAQRLLLSNQFFLLKCYFKGLFLYRSKIKSIWGVDHK